METIKRRDCATVINKIIEIVPSSNIDFIKALHKCRKDAFYKAPEETIHWIHTSEVLQEFIPETNDLKDWQWQVLEIFTTKNRVELMEK